MPLVNLYKWIIKEAKTELNAKMNSSSDSILQKITTIRADLRKLYDNDVNIQNVLIQLTDLELEIKEISGDL